MSHTVKISQISSIKTASQRDVQKLVSELRKAIEDIKREIEYLNTNKKDK